MTKVYSTRQTSSLSYLVDMHIYKLHYWELWIRICKTLQKVYYASQINIIPLFYRHLKLQPFLALPLQTLQRPYKGTQVSMILCSMCKGLHNLQMKVCMNIGHNTRGTKMHIWPNLQNVKIPWSIINTNQRQTII